MTQEHRDFFANERGLELSPGAAVAGRIGLWTLHVVKFMFLAYSGYHGVSVAISYAGSLPLAKVTQVLGIASLEFTLGAIYLAAVNKRLASPPQWIAAGITWGIGLFLACLGIVGDSLLNSGAELSPFLIGYLQWGLPIAPVIMAVGGVVIHLTDPDHLALLSGLTEQRALQREITAARYRAAIATEKAGLEAEKAALNFRLNAALQRAQLTEQAITQAAVREAIQSAADGDRDYHLANLGITARRPQALSVTAIPLEDHPPTAGNGVTRPTPPPSH